MTNFLSLINHTKKIQQVDCTDYFCHLLFFNKMTDIL